MKTTIAKNTIIEAEKLATLYAGDLRGKGYTPSQTSAVTSDKVMRVQFQNGVFNTAFLPVSKLAKWTKDFPENTRFVGELTNKTYAKNQKENCRATVRPATVAGKENGLRLMPALWWGKSGV